MHIDLLTPLPSTKERLWHWLNVHSAVGNCTLLTFSKVHRKHSRGVPPMGTES